ncbi:MAG TPA: uroporphyrinogen-III C-methyltransferase [Gammaproteobacteria bacterium]|nr:uroporphyrinogen-III C-methyltransferase [Gammaproteobacteria bacterium]
MSAVPEGRSHRSPPSQPQSPLAVLGLIFAVAALLLAGVDAYRLRETRGTEAAVEQRLADLQRIAAPKDALAEQDAIVQQALKAESARLDQLDAAYADLRKHSEEGRDAWIKAEAASLLVAANEEVEIRHDPVLAFKALQEADSRLKLISDPRLIGVRQEIARESNALRAVPEPDVEGMAVALAGIAESVDTLPMKRTVPEHYAPGGNLNDNGKPEAQGFWDRFKAAAGRLADDMFTVRSHDVPVEPLLAPREEFLLRRNLELKLESARSALLDREGAAFKDSTRSADIWLTDYFDIQSGAVKGAVQQLDTMQQQDIAPALPDISASLTLLRQLESPRNAAP